MLRGLILFLDDAEKFNHIYIDHAERLHSIFTSCREMYSIFTSCWEI